MTEVEKLKKESDDRKRPRALRGSKEKSLKSKETNIESQQNAKGKRKRNVNAPVPEHVSADSLEFFKAPIQWVTTN